MKHLPKHLRPRWRYLAVHLETWPDADLDRRDFQRSVWFATQNLLGDAGSADADCKVLHFEFADGTGEAIVRARHGHADEARAALACVDEIRGDPVGLFVAGISGTVRACEEKYLRRDGQIPDERKVVFEDDQRSAVVRGNRYDVRTDGAFAGATELDFE
ncbi:Rpp14/Pop5 family protein [Halorussus amylolyticus]|uniref:Rpp14/Pop5 family protein n=1 Tax=Halorussus amylolyticus TaxID=1126242 RepID=UPI001044A53A|nr:Rpp14/Pop5 family protein [Halorussus amylolyticus]